MFNDYGRSRIKLFEPLLKQKSSLLSGKPWEHDLEKIRFKLGESITELKIPYHLGIEDEDQIGKSIRGLIALLKDRFEHGQTKSVAEMKTTLKTTTKKLTTPLQEKTYRTDMFPKGSLENDLVTSILASVPLIDSALLRQWLEPGGSGKGFLDWATSLLEKTLRDECKNDIGEMTSYLSLMAMTMAIKKKKELIKNLWIKGISYERLDLCTGLILHQLMKTAMEGLFTKIKNTEAIYCNPLTEAVLNSALVPQAFLLIPSNLLSSSLNPYGIRTETVEALEGHLPNIADWPTDTKELMKTAGESIKRDNAAKEALTLQYFSMMLRQHIIGYLMDYDIPGSDTHKVLYDLYREDRQRHLRDAKALDTLEKTITELSKGTEKDATKHAKLTAFSAFVTDLKTTMLGDNPGKKADDPEVINHVLSNLIAYKLDQHVDKIVSHSKTSMVDRREKFASDLLRDEFTNGRLYRFSTDTRPVLKTLAIEKEAQLVVDMKDFTKKTLKLKEIAMADFMKENFYEPILDAASRNSGGVGLVRKDEGLSLKSLPGDAAIFSGHLTNLVSLAKDIQKVIGQYREEVKKKFLPKLDTHIETIQKKYKAERIRLTEELEEMQGEGDAIEEMLISLKDEEQIIQDISREELEAAITEEMEAGLFISYGVKAETMIIEPKEDFSDTLKVAIGEKINEASRGTSRNNHILQKLETLCKKEQKKRRNKKLQLPFDFYIESTYSINIPQELEERLEADLNNKTGAGDSKVISKINEEYLNDLEKMRLEMPASSLKVISISSDIYNRGQALSDEAFKAYIKETKGSKFFFKEEIAVADLDETLRELYVFTEDALEFWVGIEKKLGIEQIEIFRLAGELTFKGFESSPPTVIYEILDSDGPFYKDLMQAHGKKWVEEAKASLGSDYTDSLSEEAPKEA